MTNDTSSEIIGRSPETTWKAVKVVAKKWGVFEGKARESQRRKAWLWKHPNDRLGEEEGGRWGKGSRRGVSPGFLNLCPASPSFPLDNPSHIIYLHVSLFCHVSWFCVSVQLAPLPPLPPCKHTASPINSSPFLLLLLHHHLLLPHSWHPHSPTSSAPPHSFDSCCFWPKEKTTVYILLSFLVHHNNIGHILCCFI